MSLQEWEDRLGSWATAAAIGSTTDETELKATTSLPTSSQWLESIEQSAMACEFEVLLNQGQYSTGMEIARDALGVVHALEDELSVYRPSSDFSTINRVASQRAVAVRYDVCQLLLVGQRGQPRDGSRVRHHRGRTLGSLGFLAQARS